jgi:hypothetical protein
MLIGSRAQLSGPNYRAKNRLSGQWGRDDEEHDPGQTTTEREITYVGCRMVAKRSGYGRAAWVKRLLLLMRPEK